MSFYNPYSQKPDYGQGIQDLIQQFMQIMFMQKMMGQGQQQQQPQQSPMQMGPQQMSQFSPQLMQMIMGLGQRR